MGTELTYQTLNQQRQILGEILPNSMPLSISIDVTNLCNFRCFYCSNSQSPNERKEDGLALKHMAYQDFVACIDSIARAGRVKQLSLSGWGEPLLHPDIVSMVKYAKDARVADRIMLMSNGSLLTHELSEALVQAGLDNIRISLQGVDQAAYRETSCVDIDFKQFVDNIKYLYEHRGKAIVSLRIMEHMLKGREAEFEQVFANICDDYTVGSLMELVEDIDVHGRGSDLNKTYWGGPVQEVKVCSMPFFRCIIDVDGNLMPCCMLPWPCKFGSIREDFYKVWNGREHIGFLLDMLKDKSRYRICSNCKVYASMIEKADLLDGYREELTTKYNALLETIEE